MSLSFAAFCLVLGLLWPQMASAQQSSDALGQYMERTEELLAWAADLVRETDSAQARKILEQAASLHRQSGRMHEQGRRGEALTLARRARDVLWHAVRVAREAVGLEERIRLRAERFADQHAHLVERARESRNETALGFLERARNQADRARHMTRQGDFKLAWKLMEQAGELMQRSARLLAAEAGPEQLERALERARDELERARERLGSQAAPARRRLLGEAEEALQRGFAARDNGRPGQALRMAALAENLVRRSQQGPGAAPDADTVQRQMDRYDARAERLADQVREAGSQPAREFLRRANDLREKARDAQQAGESERALRQIRAAHDLLGQVEDLLR